MPFSRLISPVGRIETAESFLDKDNMNKLGTLAVETNAKLKGLTEEQQLALLAFFMKSK